MIVDDRNLIIYSDIKSEEVWWYAVRTLNEMMRKGKELKKKKLV